MLDIAALSGRYTVRRMTDADADGLFAFCKEHTAFYHYCNAEPSKARILEDLRIAPPSSAFSWSAPIWKAKALAPPSSGKSAII